MAWLHPRNPSLGCSAAGLSQGRVQPQAKDDAKTKCDDCNGEKTGCKIIFSPNLFFSHHGLVLFTRSQRSEMPIVWGSIGEALGKLWGSIGEALGKRSQSGKWKTIWGREFLAYHPNLIPACRLTSPDTLAHIEIAMLVAMLYSG